jgi:hypothetical protein
MNFVSINVNDGNRTDVFYFDYAKAFDTVSHSLLIDKQNIFKVDLTLIKLLTSYLQSGSQIVFIVTVFSNPINVTSGVPQGSLLGPLLFITYVSDLPKCLQFAKCLMYAYDTKLFMRVCNIADYCCSVT